MLDKTPGPNAVRQKRTKKCKSTLASTTAVVHGLK